MRQDIVAGTIITDEISMHETEGPGVESHLLLEQAVFELNMTPGKTMKDVVDYLLTGIEHLYPGAICSLLKLDENHTFWNYAAPNLPTEYINLINGTVPGPNVGSCGTAVAMRRVVIVSNIAEDPLWADYRIAATKFGLKACWSVPIFNSKGIVLGSFAIYHYYPKVPSNAMVQYIIRWAQMIGLLMENHEMINNLKLSNERYHLATKATHDIIWDWDLKKNTIFRHEEALQELNGLEGGQNLHSVEEWVNRIHPDDRKGLIRQLARFSRSTAKHIFHAEYRFLRGDGTYAHICDRGYILKDGDGKPSRVIGAAKDITDRIIAQKKVRDSEEQYRYFFQRNPLPMWIFDIESHRFLQVNQTAIQHYGYSAEEFYSMTIFDIRPAEEHQRLIDIVQKRKADSRTYVRGAWRHLKKNGEEIFVNIFSHKINYEGRPAMLVLANNVTKNIKLQEQLAKEKNARQREIMKSTIAVQEKERKEIGHELHDNVNQILGAAKLYMESIPHAGDHAEEYRKESICLVLKAIEEIRILSKSLVPPRLGDVGLINSIHDLIDSINKLGTVAIEFKEEGMLEASLETGLELALYRIVQEQINNILKYADASTITIELIRSAQVINLVVEDDGIGFNPEAQRKGIGFTNMINRAAVYNGKVDILSAPGEGCRLNVQVSFIPQQ